VDRCALFVDAGYVLEDGAMAVHGTRRRESVSWDYEGLVQLLASLARDRTGLPVLRCYWYESTVEGRRTAEHDALADMPGVKLRLAKMRPGRREGVETEIHRDLTTLARNGSVSEALLVSAEEDLSQVIADVQDLGMRVTMIHITVDGNWTISRSLRQECDDIIEISGAHLRPYVELIAGAEPARPDEQYAVAQLSGRQVTNGHSAGSAAASYQPMQHGSNVGQNVPPSIYTAPVVAEYQRPAQQMPVSRLDERRGAPPKQGNGAAAVMSAVFADEPTPSRGEPEYAQLDYGQAEYAEPEYFDPQPADADQVSEMQAPARQEIYAAPVSLASRKSQGAPNPDLPQRDLPARDLPARDLPPRDLPARDLPARDLPPRDLAQRGAGQVRQVTSSPSAAGGQVQEGRVAEGRVAEGRVSDSRPSDSRLSDSRLSDSRFGSRQGQGTPELPTRPGGNGAGNSSGNGDPSGYAPGAARDQFPGNAPETARGPGSGQFRRPPYELPSGPPAAQASQSPAQASQPAYVPSQNGPYSGPQLSATPGYQSSSTTVSLADAVQSAHDEGSDFGDSVARDAPALWLEAVLARKPRMPSDLEARLLQGSALPIDFLLHDEVRHALRRGFWDALERSRRLRDTRQQVHRAL
jgi:uncharacterized LabA/DUF88 family protein